MSSDEASRNACSREDSPAAQAAERLDSLPVIPPKEQKKLRSAQNQNPEKSLAKTPQNSAATAPEAAVKPVAQSAKSGFLQGLVGFQRRAQSWLSAHPILRFCYRILLIVVATIVIIAGVLMLVLPGPGWLTIFLGLAILGTEFAWARRALTRLKMQVSSWVYRWQQFRDARRKRG